MSIVQLLKEEYLFEDGEVEQIDDKVDDGKEEISKAFIVSLVDHLDKKLELSFGSFDNNIYNEIRKYMDESDGDVVKKTKERIHKIILDEKRKFLKKIQNRMEHFKIVPKKVG